MVFLGNDVLGAGAPPKGIAIISLANDKSRNKYDNVTILLDLSQNGFWKFMTSRKGVLALYYDRGARMALF